MVVRLFMLLTLLILCSAQIGAQVKPVYRQPNTSVSGFTIFAMGAMDTTGTILGALKHMGLFKLYIPTRTITLIDDLPESQAYEYGRFIRMDGGIFGSIRSLASLFFYYNPDSGFVVRKPNRQIRWTGFVSEDGPAMNNRGEFTLDKGITWSEPGILSLGALYGYSPKGTILTTQDSSPYPKIEHIIIRERGAALYATGLHQIPWVKVIRRYGSDSLLAIDNSMDKTQGMWVGKIGDTTMQKIDTLFVNSIPVKPQPAYIETLKNGTILYADRTGWYGVLNGRIILNQTFFQFGSPDRVDQPTDNIVYWSTRVGDSTVVYQIRLDNKPVVRTFRLHHDYGGKYRLLVEKNFGHPGFQSGRNTYSQYLFDVSDTVPVVIATESLLAKIDFLTASRRMLYAWRNASGAVHLINDLGDAIESGQNGVGYVTHPYVVLNETRMMESGFAFSPTSNYYWREEGCQPPAVMDTTLVFGGPDALREFTTDGRLLRTLLKAPTTFTSVIDDSVVVSGRQNIIRFHRGSAIDTVLFYKPASTQADTIGFSSGVARAADGSLVMSVFGTQRLTFETELPREYRWGGIMRSTTDGTTWTPVDMPNVTGRYVFPLVRTSANTLLAVCMRMVEDTTLTNPGNTEPDQSWYDADNVGIIRSADNGETWSQVHTVFYRGPYSVTAGTITEYEKGRFVAATLGGILLSTDDGRTWSVDERLPGNSIPSSVTVDNGAFIVAASDGVYRLDVPTSVADASTRASTTPISANVYTRAQLAEIMNELRSQDQHPALIDLAGKCYEAMGSAIGATIVNGYYTLVTNKETRFILVLE